MATRREVLVAAGAALAATAGRPAYAALDLDDPATNLEAYIRLRGDISGRPVFDMIRGRIYGLVEGEQARPLFRTIGAQVSRYRRVSPLEFAAQTRYVGLLTDWDTDRLLTSWTNPYTGRDCEVPVTRYGPSEVRFLTDRMVSASFEAPDGMQPSARPWHVTGDVVHMIDQVFSPATGDALPDADMMTFTGSWSLLNDAGLARIPSQLSFTAVENWRDWMDMDRAGSLLWHVNGVKLEGPADYPDELVDMLNQQDPEFFEETST